MVSYLETEFYNEINISFLPICGVLIVMMDGWSWSCVDSDARLLTPNSTFSDECV